MVRSHLLPLRLTAIAAAVAALAARGAHQDGGRVIHEPMHHLGNDKTPQWNEAPADPEPSPLVVRFESKANASEWVLEVTARDVDDDWTLELNGTRLGLLKRRNAELAVTRFVVPAGGVADGENALKLTGRDPNEDITVGRFTLHERSLREVAKLGRVDVTVTDAADGSALPARITVADAAGNLVALYYVSGEEERTTAVRPGIAYTSRGAAALEIPEGRYSIWASRGMEWSAAKADVEVRFASRQQVALALTREVDTTGWVAADTHIHTFTYSGHGDSNVEERMCTLAGEGIELAIATDHNHQTDYRPFQEKLALTPWFTPVTGNEVTTDNGHMNAFPLPPGKDVPPYKVTDWATLVEGIRAKGAKVVILNHPRWPEGGRDPLTAFGFDNASGERKAAQRFTFDCLELVNSDGPSQPWEVVLPVWYGLLDRGEVFTGVGASDSHHVGVIVGQGRTYVPSATDDPAKIDVDEACRQFKQGRVSVSYGLFATIEIEGRGMGDTVTLGVGTESVDATVLVRHPSWVTAERLDLVVDGAVAASVPLTSSGTHETQRVPVKLPRHDAWVVAVATGAKVTTPFWAMSLPRAVAVTNPIFLDCDGVAGWQSPRATAQRLLAQASAGGDGPASGVRQLPALLAQVDDAVAIQALELARDDLRRAAQAELETIAASAGDQRAALRAWAKAQQPAR